LQGGLALIACLPHGRSTSIPAGRIEARTTSAAGEKEMNIKLLKRLRTRFLRMRHKEHFHMKAIAAKTDCGTVMCIAGHTLDLAGYKMRLDPDRDTGNSIYEGRMDFDFISPDGDVVANPLKVAGDELGLPFECEQGNIAFDLFHDYSLKTPKDAATRIQQLIESHVPENVS
jgi:hypothetical protein